jgi:hypothetical protein
MIIWVEDECEQCGCQDCLAYHDSHRRSYTVSCPRCGYSYCSEPQIDQTHLEQTGETRWLLSDDGEPIPHSTTAPGYGTYRITYRDGGGTSGAISRPIDDEMIELFRATFAMDEVDETKSHLAKWDPGVQAVVEILGTYRGPHRADRNVELPPGPGVDHAKDLLEGRKNPLDAW